VILRNPRRTYPRSVADKYQTDKTEKSRVELNVNEPQRINEQGLLVLEREHIITLVENAGQDSMLPWHTTPPIHESWAQSEEPCRMGA
jgi:hypothetical protein